MRALLGLSLMLATPALGADLDLFNPSGSLIHNVGTLQGEAPMLAGDGPSVALMSWIAEDLAVLEYRDGSSEPVLGTAFAMPLYGAYTIAGHARVEVLVPLYLYADAPVADFRGAGLGDVELRAMVPLYEASDAFSIGVVPALAFPTGLKDPFLTQGWQGRLTVAVGGMPDPRAGWLANVSVSGAAADAVETLTLGSRLDVVVGAWWQAQSAFRLGGDFDFGWGFAKQEGTDRVALITGHVFAQVLASNGLSLTVGGGTGLGAGAPAYRIFAAIGWGPVGNDADGDGVADGEDACPQEPEDRDRWEDADGCPDPDNDGDGMLDGDDVCPDEAEDFDGYGDLDGCLDADNDGDGLADADDRCPDRPGRPDRQGCADTDSDGLYDDVDECPDEAGTVAAQGCPDADGDLVPDQRDACPDEPITAEADPKYSDGCPSAAFVTAEGRIQITQKINFELGSAKISAEAAPVLDEVARILLAHDEIDLIEVAGHTDNVGDPERNQELSEERAEAVALYLADKGVPTSRLMPKGYGQTDPIDTNRTSSGRANNRRIEFTIRRWKEGTEPGAEPEQPGWPVGTPAEEPAPEPAAEEPTEEPPAETPGEVPPTTPRPADEPIWR